MNGYMKRGSRYATLILVLFLTTCAKPSPEDPHFVTDSVHPLIPISMGMPLEELEKRTQTKFPTDRVVLINPSELARGGPVRLNNGIEVTVAFDGKDQVCYVATEDSRVWLAHGLGPGSTFLDAKRHAEPESIFHMSAYGTMVRIRPYCWLVFRNDNESIKDSESECWLEFRDDQR
ncbi:MAG TPA: hypothetical protein VJZ71_19920 [Phycisphaerae bacterium]|nr:hypothetical protein [Phycisphaerae bacterium]